MADKGTKHFTLSCSKRDQIFQTVLETDPNDYDGEVTKGLEDGNEAEGGLENTF